MNAEILFGLPMNVGGEPFEVEPEEAPIKKPQVKIEPDTVKPQAPSESKAGHKVCIMLYCPVYPDVLSNSR